MSYDKEAWKPVVGWEGLYEVSDHGRVRSLNMDTPAGRRKGRILSPWLTKWGYFQVHLSRSGRRSAQYIHQLVLKAFIGPRPEGMEACHGDADRTNNRKENLRWDTVSANRIDITRAGNNRRANQTHCSRGHELSGVNLRTSRSGGRSCISCNRAHAYARNVLGQVISQELADSYYRRLTQ